jgi:hypothetical protein
LGGTDLKIDYSYPCNTQISFGDSDTLYLGSSVTWVLRVMKNIKTHSQHDTDLIPGTGHIYNSPYENLNRIYIYALPRVFQIEFTHDSLNILSIFEVGLNDNEIMVSSLCSVDLFVASNDESSNVVFLDCGLIDGPD